MTVLFEFICPIGSTYKPDNSKSPCRPLPAGQRSLDVAFLKKIVGI